MRKTLFTLAMLAAAAATAHSQAKLAPPPLGPLVVYQYWPTQYIQFVTGPELPYSMFEFDTDTAGKNPIYHAVLTGKTGRRTHYSNTDALAAYYKATGEESYKVDFAVESDESEKVGATTTVRFAGHDEKAVEFRFVQGSDISEQGSGLQPLPQAPIPILAYREQGALAGEGTALKIGDTVSTAEVWKEYAHPPYFVPYRGAVTSSAHLIVLPKLTETWTVTKYPDALSPGATWLMDNDRHNHLTLKLEKVAGPNYTFTVTTAMHPDNRISLEATRAGEVFTTTRISYMPAAKGGEKHAATFTYTPGLTLAAAKDATTGTLELGIGKKQKIVTATTSQTGDAADRTTAIAFTAPAWLTSKPVTDEVKITADTATITQK